MENIPLVVPTEIQLNLEAMVKSLDEVLAIHPFNEQWQVCLTHRPGVEDLHLRAYEGAGPLASNRDEFDYSEPNEAFRGTYFYEILHSMKRQWQLGRSRLMRLPAGRCYTMHRDKTAHRFHVAVITNPNCFMAYKSGQIHHIPADGRIYRMDVQAVHSAFNAGLNDRVHFLFEFKDKALRPPS